MKTHSIQVLSTGKPRTQATVASGKGSGVIQAAASLLDLDYPGLWREQTYSDAHQSATDLRASLALIEADAEVYRISTTPDYAISCGDYLRLKQNGQPIARRIKSLSLSSDGMTIEAGQRLLSPEDVIKTNFDLISNQESALGKTRGSWGCNFKANISDATGASRTFVVKSTDLDTSQDYEFLLGFTLDYYISTVTDADTTHDHDGETGLGDIETHGDVGSHDEYFHTSVAGYHDHAAAFHTPLTLTAEEDIYPVEYYPYEDHGRRGVCIDSGVDPRLLLDTAPNGSDGTPKRNFHSHYDYHFQRYGERTLDVSTHFYNLTDVHNHMFCLGAVDIYAYTYRDIELSQTSRSAAGALHGHYDNNGRDEEGNWVGYDNTFTEESTSGGLHDHLVHSCATRAGSDPHTVEGRAINANLVEGTLTYGAAPVTDPGDPFDVSITVNGTEVDGSPFYSLDLADAISGVDISSLILFDVDNTITVTISPHGHTDRTLANIAIDVKASVQVNDVSVY